MHEAKKHVQWLPDCRRNAFTLIEVLVVVAIIGLLVAVLIPSLAQAREQGVRAYCASNMHQQGIGLTTYAQDHKSWLPYRGWFSYTIYEHKREALGSTGAGGQVKIPCNLGLLVGRYVSKDWDVVYCPRTIPDIRDMPAGGISGGLPTKNDSAIPFTYGGYNYAQPIEKRGHQPRLDNSGIYPLKHMAEGYKNLLRAQEGLPTTGSNLPEPRIPKGMQALVSDWGVGGPAFGHKDGLHVLYSDAHARFLRMKGGGTSGSPRSFDMWLEFNRGH